MSYKHTRVACVDDNGLITNIVYGTTDAIPKSKFIGAESSLNIGDVYDQALAWAGDYPPDFVVEVVINDVIGALPDFDDDENEYTVQQGSPLTATANLAAADEKFVVPFMRTDNGRKHNAVAELVNGVVSISVTFPTTGEYVLNSDLLNSKRKHKIFSIRTQIFNVV